MCSLQESQESTSGSQRKTEEEEVWIRRGSAMEINGKEKEQEIAQKLSLRLRHYAVCISPASL